MAKANKPGDAIPFFHGDLFHLLVWLGALHLPDAHGVDLGGVIDSLFSGNITVVASNRQKKGGRGVGLPWLRRGWEGRWGGGTWLLGLTSILFGVGVRLLAVHQLALLRPHKLPGPDHQGRVGAPYREQHGVIVQPPHVGDMGAVPHVLLAPRVLAL